MVKLVNPLYYPVAVLVGGLTLFVGVRLGNLSSLVMLPVATGVTVAGASFFKSREGEVLELDNPALEREILAVKSSALALANQSQAMRLEVQKLLTDTFHMELLTTVLISCDRAAELPSKLDKLEVSLHHTNSLLSIEALQQQLTEVKTKLPNSSGVAKRHLNQLAESLKRNIQLAQEGEDSRLSRVINIATLIQDFAGILQKLQTKLRTSDLIDSEQINALQLIADELNSLAENLDLVVRQ
ncbi:hypothetical protein H6G74_26300 [Nostoc spongiaeforme FACHB-130]|uniref:Uncharacterized protein n=1 Tax=Nostoc spongiaeforme FACHB-130 TaxID=1357510 RepID=A0ABR8G3R9_9NOSO|nr:hypothetical protein [Nostoc spongiaeforme]MBD2597809.1 hypothetical protein [Nostoc spongiaeforme FACHB-130]